MTDMKLQGMEQQGMKMQDMKLQDSYCFLRSISTIDLWSKAAVSEHAQNSLIAGMIELDDRCDTSALNVN